MVDKFDGEWEGKILKEVLLEHLKESRRTRRWGIFFKLSLITFVIMFIFISLKSSQMADKRSPSVAEPHIAKLEIKGMISDKSEANADDIIYSLEKAFKNDEVKAIVLSINSPGGTAVHARRIYNAIIALKEKRKESNSKNAPKVYAVIDEIATSAAYLIASAADEIYADETSFVGSIGALVNGFGFVDTLDKLGIERRLYVAGKHKAMLDPFSPENEVHKEFIQKSLDIVHDEFIANVRQGRGSKLKEDENIFSGRFWTGKEAYKLGLIDGFADIYLLSKNIVKIDSIVDYTKQYSIFEKFSRGFTSNVKSFAFNPLSLIGA